MLYHKLLPRTHQILCGTVVSSGYDVSLQTLTMRVGKGSTLNIPLEYSTTVAPCMLWYTLVHNT